MNRHSHKQHQHRKTYYRTDFRFCPQEQQFSFTMGKNLFHDWQLPQIQAKPSIKIQSDVVRIGKRCGRLRLDHDTWYNIGRRRINIMVCMDGICVEGARGVSSGIRITP